MGTDWEVEEKRDNNIYSLFNQKLLFDLLKDTKENKLKVSKIDKDVNLKVEKEVLDKYDQILDTRCRTIEKEI